MKELDLSGRRSMLDVKWVARTFDVSETWVYRKVDLLEIPHYRLGSLIRFHHRELSEWFAKQRGQ
jgi:excisionase family DNA binding protein